MLPFTWIRKGEVRVSLSLHFKHLYAHCERINDTRPVATLDTRNCIDRDTYARRIACQWVIILGMETVDKLARLENLLQMNFHDRSLLERAVTHHSCCPETAVRDSYDTLEFLGDALLGAFVVEHIYHAFPNCSEGEMTALKSEVVSRRVLARVGQELGLFEYVRVDVANLRTFNERSRDSLCADVLEALIGAIHLDQGAEAARSFMARTILPMVTLVHEHARDANPKGRLQGVVLRRSGMLPRYRVLEQGGSNNDRVFTVGVFEQDLLLGLGRASSIKEAGRLAASEALDLLRAQEIDEHEAF